MPSILLSISPCNSCNSPPIAPKLHLHNNNNNKNHYNKLRRNQTASDTSVHSFQHYVRTGRMHDARVRFDAKPERTLVEYTTLMSGYIFHGHSMEAMLLLHDMLHLPFPFVLDPFAVSAALRACASTGSFHFGKELHCLVLKMGYLDDLFVANALVTMYSDCGSLNDAELVFNEIKQPDLVSWSSMLGGYMKNGRDDQVLRLIREMSLAGVQFDAFVLSIALKVCANLGAIATGMQLHCYTVKIGLDSCTFLMNSVMDFYGRSCRLSEMRKVFDRLFHKDLVSWNTTISCYTDDHRSYEEALNLFRLLMFEGFECDDYTLGSVLQAVTDLGSLDYGKEIHGYVIKAGFWSNSFVISALLVMYMECNDNSSLLPLKLFRYLYATGEEELLDEFVMVSILKFCASRMDIKTGKMIHSCILKRGMKINPFISSSLVDMYAKCGIPEASLWVFAGIPEPGVVPWSAIIAGQCTNGRFQEALQLFQAMQSDSVKANEFTLTAVIQACAALRDLKTGKQIHCSLIRAGYGPNASVSNSLISFYLEIRQPQQALNLWALSCEDDNQWNSSLQAFSRLINNGCMIELLTDINRSNLQINASLAYHVLDACRSPSLLYAGMQAHGCITKNGLLVDHKISTCLMNMYSRCGSIELAAKAFNQIPEKTSASWGSIISASVDHDCPSKALKLFTQMRRKNKNPDSSTFVSVLQACSQLGLAEEAFQIFISMSENYGIHPSAEHYSCMVEVLGRAGMSKEAEHFIGSCIPLEHNA